jgi:glyoxylase-like metal-dependent hydrolase (beta-lactamase superfamily II)
MSKTPGTEIIELSDGVYARLHEGLTNAGIIIGENGVMIIDSLRVPSFARDLVSDIQYITDKPIQYVVDTHSHWDHSWGNEIFPESTIIGHQNCYSEMLDVESNNEWRNKIIKSNESWSEEAKTVKITPPNLTFETSMNLYFGGRAIQLMYLGKAHTSGDIFIHLPKEKILFTGDVAQDKGVPYMGDGYPSEWPETDARILSIDSERFMAGHGPIGDKQALLNAKNFIDTIVGDLQKGIKEGKNSETASKDTYELLKKDYGDWRSFDKLEESMPIIYSKLNK